MKKYGYTDIVEHYENCLDKYGDCSKGVDWPKPEDAIIRYNIMLDIIKEKEKVSLLDFGCGAAHLYDYILEKNYNIEYYGLDLSEKFIQVCQQKYPEGDFICIDILKDSLEKVQTVDYIILNGVFTEKLGLSFEKMEEYFQQMLENIFTKCKKGIAFNVMAKAVDWEREDLFHMPTDRLIQFLVKKLSRHFVIRNDYGLYEYTVYVYKKPQRDE